MTGSELQTLGKFPERSGYGAGAGGLEGLGRGAADGLPALVERAYDPANAVAGLTWQLES